MAIEPMSETPDSKPNPDPTIATNAAVERAVKAERDYVDGLMGRIEERFDGIDRATELRWPIVEGFPRTVESAVDNLKELIFEKFESVQTQFKERDTRSERESRDNKVAVDAAFAAQKEAAAKQDEGNAKAIDKSERATAETIKTNQELSKSTTDALTKSLDELKLQVAALISSGEGGRAQRVEQRAITSGQLALFGAAGLIIMIVIAIITIILATPAG